MIGFRFAHEVHPSEIAYDYWSTAATLEAIDHRPGLGLNFDPSHMVWQDLDYVGFLWDFRDRIYHVDCKDTKIRKNNGRNGRLSSHLPWADPRRGWDFISTGHGDTRWEDISACSITPATPDRSPSSGRTPAWTVSMGPRRHWISSAA
jgi:sugar phosphate isomerase/epimerase